MASKELVRSSDDKVIAGVCAGVAQYFGLDTNLVRILTVVLSVFTGVPIVAYIVGAFLLPQRSTLMR
ncbi:PspC domain-containing protein [Propionibacteriaceae bacterium Y2011]|uniref:PspC domain-containing protein n=1 Tax=Microlunatus sp. Y2014 TaxID=3418488 RepID=UPI003B4579B0